MKWKRVENGVYSAGPYLVERAPYHRAIWSVSGPGVSAGVGHETKDDAQTEAHDAALERIVGSELTVEPVKGDVVVIPGHDNAPGVYATALGDNMHCIHLRRGKRICLFRREFKVVMP
ncbi:hypothetical protein PBI_INDLOVU_92 [Mycobacterium phage Indlovu]|nr:hypothetical protein PBI_INDLOVU_92 [Mycobacterium phage Indlovu]